jgi:hypothetical protein
MDVNVLQPLLKGKLIKKAHYLANLLALATSPLSLMDEGKQ